MKTRRDASRFGWCFIHSSRRSLTYGRSCSLARSGFFKVKAQGFQGVVHGDQTAFFPQMVAQFLQGGVVVLFHEGCQTLPVGCVINGSAMAAFFRLHVSCFAEFAVPFLDGFPVDAIASGNLNKGLSGLVGCDGAFSDFGGGVGQADVLSNNTPYFNIRAC